MENDIKVLKELKDELTILFDSFEGLKASEKLNKLKNKYIPSLNNCIQKMEDFYGK